MRRRYLIEYCYEKYSDHWVTESITVDSDEELRVQLDRFRPSDGYEVTLVSEIRDTGIRTSADV